MVLFRRFFVLFFLGVGGGVWLAFLADFMYIRGRNLILDCAMKILVDNGHGVETPGKRSPDGRLREYAWNRLIARRVVGRLVVMGMDAELLVPEEEDISLRERCRRVNAFCRKLGTGNVILVSVHANAAGRGGRWYDATGWCAYTSRGNTRADCDFLLSPEGQAAIVNVLVAGICRYVSMQP